MSGIADIFGSGDDLPAVQAQNRSRTAENVTDATGADRQKQMAASFLTQNWTEPTLSNKGLLGA